MFLFIIINILYIIFSKNVVLPFKKITIETFKENKTINDFISYEIYTLIELYKNPQYVGFFIDQNEAFLFIRNRLLSFNSSKSNEILKKYHNLPNFWFNNKKSSNIMNCDDNQYCTEIFRFNSLDNTEVVIDNFKFNIYSDFITEEYKCGIIGLKNPSTIYYDDIGTYIYFFNELKEHNLISENLYTILYEDNNNIFNYNENLNLGKIIIGESPYIFNKKKYKKEEEIYIPCKDFIILVNELKFKTSKYSYSEPNAEIQIRLGSGFIKGTNLYRKEIDKIFFEDLISKELCKVENLNENIYTNKYFIYSCNNEEKVFEKIKYFPPLYLEMKTQNLTFIFTSKELFNAFNDRIYFLISFRDEKYSGYSLRWYFGDIFLRKYMTSFNYDSKSIIFYRNQINLANINSKIIYDENNTNKNSNKFNIFRVIVEIFMAILIVFMLYIIYRRFRN